MKILFMGTPDFALVSLKRLVEGIHDVCGVVTQADKPAGRGYKIAQSPIKRYALEQGIPVYQPESLKAIYFEDILHEIDPELIVVVAYGKLLPTYVLDYPRYGCVNVHGSLLPKYRGASPIQQAIIDGESLTGITIQHMAPTMDTGDIILQSSTPILPHDNAGTLHDRLAKIGAETLEAAVEEIALGTARRQKQDDTLATYCSKIDSQTCCINWSAGGKAVCNLIRGLSPYPGAYTTLEGKVLKIYDARFTPYEGDRSEVQPGTVGCSQGKLEVGCPDGVVLVEELQLEGTKRMSVKDYLRGRKITEGTVLG